MRVPLPIDEHVPAIREAARRAGAAVVVAPPGAGKTTRVPPAFADDGAVILLQPRRVAARALARRIAEERGWRVGEEVGWQVRSERVFGPKTRILVATEGVLTARLQADPLLSGFRTVILDEFHERSVHADLSLALARQAAQARGDLVLLVMSATLDADPVAEFLGGAPVHRVDTTSHPLAIEYAPQASPAEAVLGCLRHSDGHVLCFLPGVGEIRQVERELGGREGDAVVLPLHGRLDAEAQDAALAPSTRRKVLLATNVAETSLTVDGVRHVVDAGLHKVLRFDAARGLDRLVTERISLDAADQRAGRAGRTGPGRVVRLWDPRERLRLHREPEIRRIDLLSPLLEVIAWGGDPRTFEWYERPGEAAIEGGMALLARLGALDGRRLSEVGEGLRRLPLPPRLGRVLLAAGGDSRVAAACARLAEGDGLAGPSAATTSDAHTLADGLRHAAPRSRELHRDLLLRLSGLPGLAPAARDDVAVRRAFLSGYPDRVAQRRERAGRRLRLASGHGAVLARESGVVEGEFLVALDIQGGEGPEALVRLASAVEAEWLEPRSKQTEIRLDADGRTQGIERIGYDALVLAERVVPADLEEGARLRAAALRERGWDAENEAVVRRLRFAGSSQDLDALVLEAARRATTFAEVDLWGALLPDRQREVDRGAPSTLSLPSGRTTRLEYEEDGSVSASAKLQELFGLGETPVVGPRRVPVLLKLLAPNGRPVQTTRDLRSFWERTYPEVRRELRGRYPRHPWPEDPWTAEPTARAKPRR